MKRWLIAIVAVLVLLILGVLVAGALLPEEHRVSRTLRTKQSPQAIWDTINDHANEPKWRSDVEGVVSLGERDGKPVWQENYKDGNKVTLITTEWKPPTRMVRELTDLEGPFSGRWEIDIWPTPEGCNVKIMEVGKVSNPFFRFVSKYVIGHTTFMERYLKGLAGKFGEPGDQISRGLTRMTRIRNGYTLSCQVAPTESTPHLSLRVIVDRSPVLNCRTPIIEKGGAIFIPNAIGYSLLTATRTTNRTILLHRSAEHQTRRRNA